MLLCDSTKERRKAACERFLRQDLDWQRRVIWSNEKWFCLKTHPNRKNEVHLAPENQNKGNNKGIEEGDRKLCRKDNSRQAS